MNAYDVLKRDHIPKQIDEKYFNQLIKEFKESYFKEHNYFERLSNHRKPLELINELLNGVHSNDGLNILLQKIQNRSELTHIETNISTYVPHKLRDIWMNDRGLKTCYSAIKEYCKFWSKDFNTIAIHIAEYKAMLQVFKILERARKRIRLDTKKSIQIENSEKPIDTIKTLPQQEIPIDPLEEIRIDTLELITTPSLLVEYETNIPNIVTQWKNGKDKTGCAVFCNYLYQRELYQPNTLLTAKKFAFARYGNNISVMIEKIRKSNVKEDLEKRTVAMYLTVQVHPKVILY